jgi:uncharacterized protein YegP (UPF0339 family)
MPAKFQVYKDKAGKHRFRLRAENNRIVAVSEAYEQLAGAMKGVKSVQKNCSAEVEDMTREGKRIPNPKYQIIQDEKGKFRFHLKAANGEIIAKGEGYETRESCMNGIEVVRNSCSLEIADLTATQKAKTKPARLPEIETPVLAAPVTAEELPPPPVEQPAEMEAPTTTVPEEENLPPVETPTPAETVTQTETETIETKAEISTIEPALVEGETQIETRVDETEAATETFTQAEAEIIETKVEPSTPIPASIEAETQTETTVGEMEAAELAPEPVQAQTERLASVGVGSTKLELVNVPERAKKGETIPFQGRLVQSDTGEGVPRATIKILDEDKPYRDDDFLASGITEDDGSFSIDWKVRKVDWWDNTAEIYAKFEGNERTKPSRTDVYKVTVE